MESEVEPKIETVDVTKLESQVKPSLAGHGWKQRGTEVVCTTCPMNHGFYIRVGMRLTGIGENGEPIFKKVKH